MTSVWQDLRYGLRTFAKNPGFTTVAIITLALGIGAATVIFSVVDSVLLEPFPYKNVSRLATFHIHFTSSSDELDRYYFGAPEFLGFKQQNHVFEDMIGFADLNIFFTTPGGTQRFAGGLITSNAFEILGIQPFLGRPITLQDGNPGSPPVFVMSYSLWVKQFNRDANMMGKTLALNGEPRTLVAIMPPRFRFGGCDIWIPVTLEKAVSAASSLEQGPWFWPVGVLKPNATVQSVAVDLDVIAGRLKKVYPGGYLKQFNILAETFTNSYVENVKGLLFLLIAAVAMLLLIACGNVANLLLSRATVREKEMAIRASIGASRARLVRQLLVETCVLAGAGCIVGCWLAFFGLKLVGAVIPPDTIPSEVVIALKPTALWFALGTALLTTFLCGLAPSIHAMRGDLYLRVAGGSKGSGSNFRHGMIRSCLVIAEVALSLVLLVASGLIMRTMLALEHVKLGFDPANVLFTRLHHPKIFASSQQKHQFYRAVLDRVQEIRGITFVTEAITVPPNSTGLTDVIVPGRENAGSSYAASELCSEDYLHTLGIPLLRGRFFSKGEVDSAQRMVVINQTFARIFFGTQDPLGQKVKFPSWEINYSDWPRGAYFEIIGVVADTKNKTLTEPTISQVYLPSTITAAGLANDRLIILKTARSSDSTLTSIRQAIHELDSEVALIDPGTLENSLRKDFYAGPRFSLITVSTFGAAGLVLVLIGIFSVMAYTVSLRTHEIGIRVALGAQRGDVLKIVLKNGLALIAAGTIIGLIISLSLTRFIASLIWGVSATDPWTFAVVVAVITGTGLAASFLPARRAAQVDPLVALRYN